MDVNMCIVLMIKQCQVRTTVCWTLFDWHHLALKVSTRKNFGLFEVKKKGS